MATVTQPTLWEQAGRGSIEDRFARWLIEHPERYAEVRRRVLLRANRGDPIVEVADVFSDMRREGIPMNHNHRSLCSRMLVAEFPYLEEKIETRRRRSL